MGATAWQRIVSVMLVTVLVVVTLALDRGRHAPVAGYGPIPQPGATGPAAGSGLAIGDPAPNFLLLDTDDDIVELAGLRGQSVVLNFWTTWCLACPADLAVLQDLSAQADDGLHVIGIDAAEPAGRVQAATERHGVDYRMLLDRDGSVAAAYGVTGYPVTVLVDAEGVIQRIEDGPVNIDALRSAIDALAAGQ